MKFADGIGDPNPLWRNDEYAKKTRFGSIIAPPSWVFSVFAGINFGGWIIGGFAILVGGFGIANIMFVSVRERTNQIGIQKALGAKRFFILQQFLVESFILSILGGILGIIMVFIGTLIVNSMNDSNMYLTLGNILLAIFISGFIGIVAGYAPARSAARMNPVDAIGFSF